MRDNYLCVNCGRPTDLEVHHVIHLTPQNIGDLSIALNPNNLQTLCRDCHFKEHSEDKGNGHKKDKHNPLPEYVFDENGMVVLKE